MKMVGCGILEMEGPEEMGRRRRGWEEGEGWCRCRWPG